MDEFLARGFDVTPTTYAAALAALDGLEAMARAKLPPVEALTISCKVIDSTSALSSSSVRAVYRH